MFNLDLHFGLSTFGVDSKYDGGNMERFKRNLEYARELGYKYSIEFRPIIKDINSSKEIPGAHLEIFYENETSTGWSWVSTDKPQEITGLADGKYILVETTAPQGYTVAESIPFTIENGKLKDRDANTLVMKDATIIDVPDTFNMQNVIAMISGLVLVSLGTGVLFYETKKKKKA